MKYIFHLKPEKKDFENRDSKELMDTSLICEREIRKNIEKIISFWFGEK